MKKVYTIIVLACFVFARVNAQSNWLMSRFALPGIPSLEIGDQVPDLLIAKIVNSNKKSAKLGDFKDQLLVLDFWSVNCKGCVEGLPKMDALQKQFGAQLKILPVTYEKEADVLAFWKNNKHTKNLSLPSVVEDNLLLAYFKFNVLSHEVWIYKGKVIAITGPGYVDANNIEKVLSGAAVSWPVKDDFLVFDGDKQPLFALNANQANAGPAFVKYVTMGSYREGIPFGGTQGIVRDQKKTIRAYFVDKPVYELYHTLWQDILKPGDGSFVKPSGAYPVPWNPNEIAWEVSDRSKYQFITGKGYQEEWLRDRALCFESLNPDTGQTDKQVYQSVIADLNHLLGLNVRWEKRKEKVWVLFRTSGTDNFPKTSAEEDLAVGNIAWQMNQGTENPYVFDETGYKGNAKLNLKISNWKDIVAIRKAIQPYGLDLKQEERLVDKFVFTEIVLK